MAQTIPQLFLEKVKNQPDVPVQLSRNKDGAFKPQAYEPPRVCQSTVHVSPSPTARTSCTVYLKDGTIKSIIV